MKFTAILLLCVFLAGACCRASAGDDLKMWQDRASKTRAGMPFIAAEALFPVYAEPGAAGPRIFYGPRVFTSGAHEVCQYWVTPDIVINISYQRNGVDNPLNEPVIVERRTNGPPTDASLDIRPTPRAPLRQP